DGTDELSARAPAAGRGRRRGRPPPGGDGVERQREKDARAPARSAPDAEAGASVTPRVLHVIHRVSRGGAGRALGFLAGALTEFGHRVLPLDPAPGRAHARRELAAADLVHVHFWNTPELYELLDGD